MDHFDLKRPNLSQISIVNFNNILCQTFALIFLRQKLQSQNIIREMLGKALSYKKFERKMLMKSTPRWSVSCYLINQLGVPPNIFNSM